MKDIDFLPEWYQEGKRRRVHIRRQYVALSVVFLTMLSYNLTSEHRISRASAKIARLEDRRIEAQEVMAEFNQISRALGQQRAKADIIRRIDSRINVGAVLAEISHMTGEQVILNRVEFLSEPVAQAAPQSSDNSGSTIRAVARSNKSAQEVPLGDVRFRIVLAGAATDPADAAALVRKLDESAYFTRVSPSFSQPGKLSIAPKGPEVPVQGGVVPLAAGKDTFQVTEFEIMCYLANYEEVDG